MKKVNLTELQRIKLNRLWFIYGNHGKKSSFPNHKFIQSLLEVSEDCWEFYRPSIECMEEVDKVLNE